LQVWSVKFTGAYGRQMLRSTKQEDKAPEVVLSWDKAARMALGGALTHAASQQLFNEILTATTGEISMFRQSKLISQAGWKPSGQPEKLPAP
jgi:hypothetical protein